MPSKLKNDYGEIIYDDNILASIAGTAAMECYGLVGMAVRSKTDGIVELLKRENLAKGVKITSIENKLIIDLYIVVEFGTRISVVASNIIDKVKYTVENTTGLKVKEINIHVQDIRVNK